MVQKPKHSKYYLPDDNDYTWNGVQPLDQKR